MTVAIANEALNRFVSGDDAGLRDLFDERMKIAVSQEKVADTRGRAERANGAIVGLGEPIRQQVPVNRGGGELFDFPLCYERRRGHLQVAVRDEKISGLLLRPGNPTGRWKRSRGLIRELYRGTPPSG